MSTKQAKRGAQPWHLGVEAELRERPGVLLISLLTDEAGCQWLARGEVPEYLRLQAEAALAWSCTDARGIVKA